jgi:aspartyl aminopeptidase
MSDKKTDLTYETRNCWDVYAAPKHRKAMDALAARYLEFLSACKTERETIEYVRARVRKAGFKDGLDHDMIWRDMRGKTMFLARRGKRPLSEGVRLVGAHADTPRLDLKQHPLYEECGVGLAKTHYYGGIRKHQWFARPLALHGGVVRADGQPCCVKHRRGRGRPGVHRARPAAALAYGQMEKDREPTPSRPRS